MADAPDRRLSAISDKEIEPLYNIMLRGLEWRLERLGGRSPKPVEPIDNDEPTPNVSKLRKAARKGGRARNVLSGVRTATKSRFVYLPCVADPDPKLECLLKAERLASERYERLRGLSRGSSGGDFTLRSEAREAVREYRAKHP